MVRHFLLRELRGPRFVPLNILNPIEGTPMATREPLPPMEILKCVAYFRFILPRQEIMIAGGRTVNLRDARSLVCPPGASALMVGNYTHYAQSAGGKGPANARKNLGLDPNWDKHGFSDQEQARPSEIAGPVPREPVGTCI